MIVDCTEEYKKAPYFFKVGVTKENIVEFDEDEGRKIVLDIGNQLDESAGGLSVDFICNASDFSWIDPKNRIKIILCKETAQKLVRNILVAMKDI